MRTHRLARFAFALGLAALVASCADNTLAPAAPKPRADLFDDLFGGLNGLVSCSPLDADSVTQLVGPEGGVIQVGPHSLTIPEGALAESVSITAMIPAGSDVNVVSFLPEGLEFAEPATLRMGYNNCGLLAQLLPKHIAYVDDQLNILDVLSSLDLLSLHTVRASLDHFSGYSVAW